MGLWVRTIAWFKGLNKENWKKLGTSVLIVLLAFLLWHSGVQHDQTKKELRLANEALESAETAIERQMAEQVINEGLRTDLNERLRDREQELTKTKKELREDLEEVTYEYEELLSQYEAVDASENNNQELTQFDGACYVQVEALARRAADTVSDRMWSVYRNEVRDSGDRPEG